MLRSKAARARRSVFLPPQLLKEATRVAPRELRNNLSRLVIVSLAEFLARRKATAFEAAMARVAADPDARQENARIDAEFECAALDGLPDD